MNLADNISSMLLVFADKLNKWYENCSHQSLDDSSFWLLGQSVGIEWWRRRSHVWMPYQSISLELITQSLRSSVSSHLIVQSVLSFLQVRSRLPELCSVFYCFLWKFLANFKNKLKVLASETQNSIPAINAACGSRFNFREASFPLKIYFCDDKSTSAEFAAASETFGSVLVVNISTRQVEDCNYFQLQWRKRHQGNRDDMKVMKARRRPPTTLCRSCRQLPRKNRRRMKSHREQQALEVAVQVNTWVRYQSWSRPHPPPPLLLQISSNCWLKVSVAYLAASSAFQCKRVEPAATPTTP